MASRIASFANMGKRMMHTTSVLRAGKEFTTPYVAKPAGRPTSGLSGWFYEKFMKKTSTYATLVVVSAIGMDYAFQTAWDNYWVQRNKGKLYGDVIRDFPAIPPNCEEDEE